MKKPDENINNIYMFKNPIRFFIDISKFEGLITENDYSLQIQETLSWTCPIDFKIRKKYGEDFVRFIRLPNILNFYYLNNKMKLISGYPKLSIHDNSRMKLSLKTGDFYSTSYKNSLSDDLVNLIRYDELIRLDIKSFYDTIYVHTLNNELKLPFLETYISNQNNGNTSGILKGPYTSLFLAEHFLRNIVEKIKTALKEYDFKLNFFSDDIYIFSNYKDYSKIKQVISDILQDHGLSLNLDKVETHTYKDYSAKNIIDKYWNSVIRDQINYEKNAEPNKIYLNFINQLVYRMEKLDDNKLESIFIKGFFKSRFFIDLKTEKYIMTEDDLHKILYIYKEHPETILYSFNKFMKFDLFIQNAYKYLDIMFDKSLEKDFHEEQIYYGYALYNLKGKNAFKQIHMEKIIKSSNQILISYFVELGLIDNKLQELLQEEEKNWFLNYHIIHRMYLVNNIELDKFIKKYLIPKKAKKKQIDNYLKFYKQGLERKFVMINLSVDESIANYLILKKKSHEENLRL